MQRRAIAVLRVLDKKHHQKCDDGCARIASCQVSENCKTARSPPKQTMRAHATAKVEARPHCRDVHRAAVLMEKGVEKDPCEQVSLPTCWLTPAFVVDAGIVSELIRPATA